jgi:hypothetical protein
VEPKKSRVFQEIGKERLFEIYAYLDWLWETSQFVPCPIKLVADKFRLTRTHITLAILAWQRAKVKQELYGN